MLPDHSSSKPRWPRHFAAVVALAFAIGLLFLQPTRLGDDFTYWSFAFDLHERGLRAWQAQSFHDLRWPVWGACWILQGIVGPGLISFYGQPLLYLAAGATLAFWFGKQVAGSLRVAWISAVAFLFHPLLDTVCYRPMPDLSEAVWGAAAVLGWWWLMQAKTRAGSAGWAVLTGACIFIGESNRVTGALIVPVLLLGTWIYARPRFAWLVAAGVVAAAFYGLECAFYHARFGDWLHNIHANLGNKSAPGTHPIPVWSMPFRFFDTLWKGNPLAPFYCVLAVLGIWQWRKSREPREAPSATTLPLGMLVLWFVVLYLEYSCAPQSIWPWRPLVRDADRFLCGIVVPMSVLCAVGIGAFQWPRNWRPIAFLSHRPILVGAISLVLLAAITSREFFDLQFAIPMRRYLRTLPAGTSVFTHDSMRALAFLVAPGSAEKFIWRAPEKILYGTPELEKLAAESQQFWFVRALVWMNTRKALEKKKVVATPALASYFAEPLTDWATTRLIVRGDTPDLVFRTRRTPADSPPTAIEATSPEFASLLPGLPIDWQHGQKIPGPISWPIPASLRGKFVRLEIEAAAPSVEALTVHLDFLDGKKPHAELLLKPYFHPEPHSEFFDLSIPANATTCVIELRLAKSTKRIRVTGFRALVETPPPGAD